MTFVFTSSLGRWCFLKLCHSLSCPEQVLCPRRNQLNILRQKVETQPPSAIPPPPPPVYDVSTRITLRSFCPHHGTTLPFPTLPCYRHHWYHGVKHKQYLHTSLVLVALLLRSALLSSSQDCACCVSPSWSHLWPPQCQSLAPCPARQHPSLCQQCGSTEQQVWGQRGFLGVEVEGSPESQEGRGDFSPTLYCKVPQGHALHSWRMMAQERGRKKCSPQQPQLFRAPAVTVSPVSVSQAAAVLSRLTSSQREKGRKKVKGVSFLEYFLFHCIGSPFPFLRLGNADCSHFLSPVAAAS